MRSPHRKVKAGLQVEALEGRLALSSAAHSVHPAAFPQVQALAAQAHGAVQAA